MPEINATPPVVLIISDTLEATITAKLRELYDIATALPGTVPFELGAEAMIADGSDKGGRNRITNRVLRALAVKDQDRKERRLSALRADVAEVIAPYMSEAKTALSTWLALPEPMRRMMRLPSNVEIPLGAFDGVIPSTAGSTNVILRELGYTISAPPTKKGEVQIQNVLIAFPKAPPPTAS